MFMTHTFSNRCCALLWFLCVTLHLAHQFCLMSNMHIIYFGDVRVICSPSMLLFQALEFYLKGIRPSNVRCADGVWSPQANALFTSLTLNKNFYAQVHFALIWHWEERNLEPPQLLAIVFSVHLLYLIEASINESLKYKQSLFPKLYFHGNC